MEKEFVGIPIGSIVTSTNSPSGGSEETREGERRRYGLSDSEELASLATRAEGAEPPPLVGGEEETEGLGRLAEAAEGSHFS